MRVRVTSPNLQYHAMHNGTFQRLPVGAEFEIKEIPRTWRNMVEPVTEQPKEPAMFVTNPSDDEDEKEALRKAYYEKHGEEADKRWGLTRLREEVQE